MNNKFGVDRAKFLAVATALAGLASFQACVTTNEKDEETAGEAGQDAGGSKNTAGTENSGGSDAKAGEGGTSSGGGGGSAGASEGGASTGGASEGGASNGGASEGGAAGAGMCDDTVGDPACEGTSEMCHHYCVAAQNNLKPAAAEAAITCLLADTTENCDGGYDCMAAATAKGCGEDVATVCEGAIAGCTDQEENKPSCTQLLSGFNDTARAEVEACVTQDCFSVYSCAEGFFFEN